MESIVKKNKVKLLICYHKPSFLIKDEVMTPIHVGRTNAIKRMKHESESFKWLMENMIGDDTGDNISGLNDSYNEMTALYWAWKNYDSLGNPDYIGLMHYRRHFIFDESIKDVINIKHLDEETYLDFLNYSEESISDFVEGYDFIPHMGHVHNVYDHYIQNQRKEDIDLANEIVLELYPEYKEVMNAYYGGEYSNFCNMCIFSKKLFFEYCEFVFSILQEFEKRVDMTEKRFFVSERITGLFIHNLMQNENLKSKILPIAFIDEPVKIPVALYIDGEDLTTGAIDLYAILKNKEEYHSYDLHIFCEKGHVNLVEEKIEQYVPSLVNCKIDVIAVEESAEELPLYLEKYLPNDNKCIYIHGKVLTLHDLGEFYRTCSVDDYFVVGVPLVFYDPAVSEKKIKTNLLVLNLKRIRSNHIGKKINSGRVEKSVNCAFNGEIGYIPEYFFVSEHLANFKRRVLSGNQKRADIQAGVLWHKFMVYDDIEPEFNCQGIYSQFWWDYLVKIPYEFQKISVGLSSFENLLREQQNEINAFNRRNIIVDSGNEKLQEWRTYSLWGKLKFYYDNNGLKQTIKYVCKKIIKRGKA